MGLVAGKLRCHGCRLGRSLGPVSGRTQSGSSGLGAHGCLPLSLSHPRTADLDTGACRTGADSGDCKMQCAQPTALMSALMCLPSRGDTKSHCPESGDGSPACPPAPGPTSSLALGLEGMAQDQRGSSSPPQVCWSADDAEKQVSRLLHLHM